MQPVGEELHRAAIGQQLRRRRGQLRADGVARTARVPVGVARCTGSDHERRVAHHEVEASALDRTQQVAGEQLPLHPVERGGRRREPKGPRGQVGGRDAARVGGQLQCLYAASGADVERRGNVAPHGRGGKGCGGVADPENMVGA
jgi:hypothetical protein